MLFIKTNPIESALNHLKTGGQFDPETGGQFAPENGGQFQTELSGQFKRNFHIKSEISVLGLSGFLCLFVDFANYRIDN